MSDTLIFVAKKYINDSNLTLLKEMFENCTQEEMDWQHIYQKVYLHACLKKKTEIKVWLEEVFETFDPISKIALRQIFPYGKWLYNRTYY
jgi:hypothetical protein